MSGPQKSFEESLKGVRSKKGVPKKCHFSHQNVMWLTRWRIFNWSRSVWPNLVSYTRKKTWISVKNLYWLNWIMLFIKDAISCRVVVYCLIHYAIMSLWVMLVQMLYILLYICTLYNKCTVNILQSNFVKVQWCAFAVTYSRYSIYTRCTVDVQTLFYFSVYSRCCTCRRRTGVAVFSAVCLLYIQ